MIERMKKKMFWTASVLVIAMITCSFGVLIHYEYNQTITRLGQEMNTAAMNMQLMIRSHNELIPLGQYGKYDRSLEVLEDLAADRDSHTVFIMCEDGRQIYSNQLKTKSLQAKNDVVSMRLDEMIDGLPESVTGGTLAVGYRSRPGGTEHMFYGFQRIGRRNYYYLLTSEFPDIWTWLRIPGDFPLFQFITIWLMFCVIAVNLVWYGLKIAFHPLQKILAGQKQLIQAVSHELKTPIQVISANNEMIGMQAFDDFQSDSIRRYTQAIDKECLYLKSLVSELLEYNSADSTEFTMQMQPVNLHHVLIETASSIEPVCTERGIQLKLEDSENLPEIQCDPQRLSQILRILLDNAAEASDQGQTILLKASADRRQVFIRVIDQGGGISKQEQERIFEPLYMADKSRKRNGHFGLGLSIAAKLSKQMGITLVLEKSSEKGSVFLLKIPF